MNDMKLKKIRGVNEYYLDENYLLKGACIFSGMYKQIVFEDDDILWFTKENHLIIDNGIVNSLNSMI